MIKFLKIIAGIFFGLFLLNSIIALSVFIISANFDEKLGGPILLALVLSVGCYVLALIMQEDADEDINSIDNYCKPSKEMEEDFDFNPDNE